MIDTDSIVTGIQDFFHRKPLLFTVIAIFIFLSFAGLIVVFIQSSPDKKKVEAVKPEEFTQLFTPLAPSEPEIEKDYYPSRITKDKWSEEDIKEWITIPDENEIKKLEQANDKIVSDITGAVP